MKARLILFLIILFAACSFTFAQKDTNHGLVLRGRIYDGKQEVHKDYVIWKAKLAMEFVNEGTEAIILINPQRQFGKWQSRVNFLNREINYRQGKSVWHEDILGFSQDVVRESDDLSFLKMAEILDSENPPSDYTVTLNPQEALPFDDTFEVRQGCENPHFYQKTTLLCDKWEKMISKKKNGEGRSAVSSLPFIKVVYRVSFVSYQNNANLLENLQTRWRKFGFLPVDINGGFSITSEKIANNYGYQDNK